MIRLLILDPEASIRRGLQMRLEMEPDLTVVGQAGDLAAALTILVNESPDVVLVDPELPDLDAAAVAQLLQCGRQTRVVVLSLRDDRQSREQALAAGAAAFVGKHEGVDFLLKTIRRVAASV